MVGDSPSYASFLHDALVWSRSDSERALTRALRSAHSGVNHDVAAAYALVASRVGPLLEAIARDRLALPLDERETIFHFAQRMRALRDFAAEADDARLFERVRELFPAPSILTSPSVETPAVSLAEAVAPETASGVRARQAHFSASALNAYAECPRKWYYRYVCAAVEDRGSSASTYGTALHAALEDFHGEFPRPEPSRETAMRERIVKDVTWAFERYRADFSSPLEVALHARRAQRTAQRYVDWIVAESQRAPFTVIGREVPVNLDLDGFAFVGFIDRVDRDERSGAISIFDYKTGSIATSAREYREKIARFVEFQLPFYYWARTAQGDRVTRLALIPLKDALVDVTPVSLEIVSLPGRDERRSDAASGTISIGELERARERMVDICRELTGGEITAFAVTRDPSACRYCAYADACARRPHDERERFGR